MSRSNLMDKRNARAEHYKKEDDQSLLCRIGKVIRERPAYGYRRVTAFLRSELKEGAAVVNHKRIYRLMKRNNLLLQKPIHRPKRLHDGKVETLHSNTRWCSDSF